MLSQPSQQQTPKQEQDGFDQLEDIIESFSNIDPKPTDKTNTNQIQPKVKLEEYIKQSRSICGCGRTYTCNSALYYHIKTKHNNVPPVGTIGTAIKDTAPSPTFIGSYLLRLKTLITGNRYQYFSIYLQKMPRQRKTLITVFSIEFTRTTPKPKQNKNFTPQNQMKQFGQHALSCKCGDTFLTLLDLNLHIRQKHLNWRSEVQSHPHGSFVLEEMKEYNSFEGTLSDFVDNSNGVVRQIYECRCGLVFTSNQLFGQHLKKHEKKAMSHPELQQFKTMHYTQNETDILQADHLTKQVTKNQQYPKVKPQIPSKLYLPFQTKHQPFRKLYFCGICSGLMDNCQQLVTHIEQKHKNEQPKRNLQTIEKQKLILRIAVPFESPQLEQSGEVDKFNFLCGCGHNYSCSSSLNLHIRRIHSGIAPPGTVGGPRGLPKQRVEDQY